MKIRDFFVTHHCIIVSGPTNGRLDLVPWVLTRIEWVCTLPFRETMWTECKEVKEEKCDFRRVNFRIFKSTTVALGVLSFAALVALKHAA